MGSYMGQRNHDKPEHPEHNNADDPHCQPGVLIDAIRRDRLSKKKQAKERREERREPAQLENPLDNPAYRELNEKYLNLESRFSLLAMQNDDIISMMGSLESEFSQYRASAEQSYSGIEARLRQSEESRAGLSSQLQSLQGLMSRLNEKNDALERRLSQRNSSSNAYDPGLMQDAPHLLVDPRKDPEFAARLSRALELLESEDRNGSHTGFSHAGFYERIGRTYRKVCDKVSERISSIEETLKDAYSGIKERISEKKRSIIAGAAIGAVSLVSLLASYYLNHRNTATNPDYSHRSSIVYVMPAGQNPISQLQQSLFSQASESGRGQHSEETGQAQEQAAGSQTYDVYVVKKGDTLWSIGERYLRVHDMDAGKQDIYSFTDVLAELNGKGRQADYKISVWDPKSPHCIMPGEEIKVPR